MKPEGRAIAVAALLRAGVPTSRLAKALALIDEGRLDEAIAYANGRPTPAEDGDSNRKETERSAAKR